MTKIEAFDLISEAFVVLRDTKHLPITLTEVSNIQEGYILKITDTKILTQTQRLQPDFEVHIYREIWEDMETSGIDMYANIPNNCSDKKRVILRIAYCIFYIYQSFILDVFKKSDTGKKEFINLKNAIKWYSKL